MPLAQPIGEKIPWYLQRKIVFPILIPLAVVLVLNGLVLPLFPAPWGVIVQVVLVVGGLFFAALIVTLIVQYEGKWHTYRSFRASVEVTIPGDKSADIELSDHDILPVSVTMANNHVVVISDKSLGEIMGANAFTYRRRFFKGYPETTDVVLEVD